MVLSQPILFRSRLFSSTSLMASCKLPPWLKRATQAPFWVFSGLTKYLTLTSFVIVIWDGSLSEICGLSNFCTGRPHRYKIHKTSLNMPSSFGGSSPKGERETPLEKRGGCHEVKNVIFLLSVIGEWNNFYTLYFLVFGVGSDESGLKFNCGLNKRSVVESCFLQFGNFTDLL